MPMKLLLATGLIGSLTGSVAMAQGAPNFDPATIEALKTLNTPEKRANMIRDGFHVVQSKRSPTNFPCRHITAMWLNLPSNILRKGSQPQSP